MPWRGWCPIAGRCASCSSAFWTIEGARCFVTRSGYTGEDGFEISVPGDAAEGLARRLLAMAEVKPVGLGARDSLRLEAGLCLYGHDIDETTTPIEAGLAWSIGERRRREGGFPGAAIIQRQLWDGTHRRRVGILPEGRQPAREHTEIQNAAGQRVGEVTSGGFGPSLNGPLAMGYAEIAAAAPGHPLNADRARQAFARQGRPPALRQDQLQTLAREESHERAQIHQRP